MIKFNKCKLNSEILDQWVNASVNVLLVGEKGVGKSHQIIETFKRNKLKYAYFSGATLDPWIHLLGIPKAKIDENGREKMEFVLPENLDHDVEAIFCDEWNRTNKVVRNALLELQQFKSINGRKFPNLKMVWGAVNPPKNEEDESSGEYDVDELDPAQLDRFHVVVELPNEPDSSYFKNKYGDFHGRILIDWWKEQPKEALKILSPRRLDYVGECFKKGLDIKYLLPVSANFKELIKKLSLDETQELINMLLNNPTEEGMRDFLKDDKNFLKYKNKLKNENYWKFWKYVSKEFITEEIKINQNFQNYSIYQTLTKDPIYREIFTEIAKSNPNHVCVKILKSLLNQNYIVEQPMNAMNFVGNQSNFVIINVSNSNQPDAFSDCMYQWNGINKPKKYDCSNTIYNITTSDRRKAMICAVNCLKNISNKHHFINFMMSNLRSMQKATIQNDKNFLKLLGNACVFAKEELSEEELKQFVNDLNANTSKISSNRIQEFINYINGKCASVLPESFLKKLQDIRSVLTISDSDNITSLLSI
jgi:hypothetical protein